MRAINQLTYSKEPRIGEALLFLPKCLFDGINARLRFGDFAFEHFYLNLEFLAASIQLVVGTSVAAALLGTVNQIVTNLSTPVVGEVALLLAAVILLRLLPEGITGRFFRGGL